MTEGIIFVDFMAVRMSYDAESQFAGSRAAHQKKYSYFLSERMIGTPFLTEEEEGVFTVSQQKDQTP
jgi:hypothetical protein